MGVRDSRHSFVRVETATKATFVCENCSTELTTIFPNGQNPPEELSCPECGMFRLSMPLESKESYKIPQSEKDWHKDPDEDVTEVIDDGS